MLDDKKREEIQYIYELLQSCIEEEGYEIPFSKYADNGYKGFRVPLRNGSEVLVKIEWN